VYRLNLRVAFRVTGYRFCSILIGNQTEPLVEIRYVLPSLYPFVLIGHSDLLENGFLVPTDFPRRLLFYCVFAGT
jgi:hypothetical protein